METQYSNEPNLGNECRYFYDNYKRYYNGLTSFKGDMLNNRFPAKTSRRK